MTNAHAEGDDMPSEPIRIFLYGDGFASIDGELAMSAFGPGGSNCSFRPAAKVIAPAVLMRKP
jgi:hypothetical protein